MPIEERDATEVTHIDGLDENGEMKRVKLTLSPGGNLAFDITPAKYVTAYVTEQGLLSAADLIERAG